MACFPKRHTAGVAIAVAGALFLSACGTGRDTASVQTSGARSWGFPGLSFPGFGRSPRSSMPAAEVECRRNLKRLGVSFRNLPTIRDSASCGIDYPVEITSLARNIKLAPKATLSCAMAEQMARWAQRDLAPAARLRYLSGVAEVRQMSSYSCRRISGSSRMSAHSKGNALDIGAIELKNGRVIDVEKQGLFAFRARSLLNNVRGDACGRFSTVLGPGYNYDHRNHFHFDLMERSSGRRSCH